jgi:hypothetical protein
VLREPCGQQCRFDHAARIRDAFAGDVKRRAVID